tara:strand:+ start:1465 stop:1632 length:168 start_codon:yes stop_codon:yes gene_type:complete
MKTKQYQVIMLIDCEPEATKYIAQSVCDGLEEPTAVKHINIKEYKPNQKNMKKRT